MAFRARAAQPGRRPRIRSDEKAVTDLVGNLLLVGITVLAMAGLGAAVMQFPAPGQKHVAHVAVALDAGKGGWGTGDETIQVRHAGGGPMDPALTRVHVRQAGTTTTLTGAALGGAFAGGLHLGETWIRNMTINGGEGVAVGVAYTTDAGTVLIGDGDFKADTGIDCSGDTSPPIVASRTQAPVDVTAVTSGPVTVTYRFADDCSGLDSSAPPQLRYRINPGIAPLWTGLGPMTAGPGGTWTGQIPEPISWATVVGQTLEYQAEGMVDHAGNGADGPVHSDVIQLLDQHTYVTCPVTVIEGTVTACADMQSDADGGLEARLDEASLSSNVSLVEYGTTFQSRGAVDAQNARGAPDGLYAILPSRNDHVRVGGYAGGGTGQIVDVELAVRGHYTGAALIDDNLRLRFRLQGNLQPDAFDLTPGTTDTTFYRSVGASRTWTWSDIRDLEIEARYQRTGAEDPADFNVDALWVRVTSRVTTYSAEANLGFQGVPSANNELQLRHRTFGDTFRVEVKDAVSGSWNVRGAPLTAASSTDWTYTLAATEQAAGVVQIRIVDLQVAPQQQGIVLLDYARVHST